MKVTVNENEKSGEITYPCLMKSKNTGRIVLFTENGKGIVVSDTEGSQLLATYSDSLVMEYFTPFPGSVTLSND